jgi:hypothetical protein
MEGPSVVLPIDSSKKNHLAVRYRKKSNSATHKKFGRSFFIVVSFLLFS